MAGPEIFSCSTDEVIRIWNFDKKKIKGYGPNFKTNVSANRPSDEVLYPYREAAGPLKNFAPDHILNTEKALKEQHK